MTNKGGPKGGRICEVPLYCTALRIYHKGEVGGANITRGRWEGQISQGGGGRGKYHKGEVGGANITRGRWEGQIFRGSKPSSI